MGYEYDDFFEKMLKVYFGKCMQYQDEVNEQLFYLCGVENDIGKVYRKLIDNWVLLDKGVVGVLLNLENVGGMEQWYVILDEFMVNIYVLIDEEMGFQVLVED